MQLDVGIPSQASALIWSYDLAPVTARLRRKGQANAEQLEQEFRKLAVLWYFHPGQCIAPSKEVDVYWHEFILDTRRYRDFCDRVYGRFIEHVPDDSGSGMMPEYQRTREFYRAHFGEPNPELWEEATGANSFACGSSCRSEPRAPQ